MKGGLLNEKMALFKKKKNNPVKINPPIGDDIGAEPIELSTETSDGINNGVSEDILSAEKKLEIAEKELEIAKKEKENAESEEENTSLEEEKKTKEPTDREILISHEIRLRKLEHFLNLDFGV